MRGLESRVVMPMSLLATRMREWTVHSRSVVKSNTLVAKPLEGIVNMY